MILVSTRNGLDVLTFRDPADAAGYCERMEKLGISCEMDVY